MINVALASDVNINKNVVFRDALKKVSNFTKKWVFLPLTPRAILFSYRFVFGLQWELLFKQNPMATKGLS